MNKDQILSPRAVEGRIADGQTIVIFEDMVLRLDGWLDKHPGGRLAIEHMVGRDATDEIKAYHSAATLKTMRPFRIGRKQGPWVNHTPPIRGGIFRKEETPSVEIACSDGDSSDVTDDTEDDSSSIDDAKSQISLVSHISSECSCDHANTSSSNSKGANGNLLDGLRRRSPAAECASCSAAKSTAASTPAVEPRPARNIRVANAAVLREMVTEAQNYPSLDPKVQEEIARKYQLLHERVQDAGLYECPYIEYGKEMMRYSTLFTLFLVALRYEWYMTSAVFLGLFWHQIMFTAHDAGHRAITQNFEIDSLIGMFIADFCCGLSIGWWKSSHNVHHLVTNQPEHDPDIQNVPLFATCPSFFKSLHSSYYDFTFVWDAVADVMVPLQAYTYYPIMGIARFNLYLLSWLHVLSKKSSGLGSSKAWWIRPTEIAFMCCFWFLFGYCLLLRTLPNWTIRVAFVLVSHIVTMPLHVQITLSHWGMSTVDLGESESFAQRQLRTTMDVDCPAWLDFIHGGLQFQAVHHLFPRAPRHNLRKIQAMVREFCDDTGVSYSILGFVDGNQKVLGRLQEVGNQVKVMVDCQKYMAATGESGLA